MNRIAWGLIGILLIVGGLFWAFKPSDSPSVQVASPTTTTAPTFAEADKRSLATAINTFVENCFSTANENSLRKVKSYASAGFLAEHPCNTWEDDAVSVKSNVYDGGTVAERTEDRGYRVAASVLVVTISSKKGTSVTLGPDSKRYSMLWEKMPLVGWQILDIQPQNS